MTLKLNLTVKNNLQIFGFFQLQSLGRAKNSIQSVFEMRVQIATTSYWVHVELGKNIKKIQSKNKMTFFELQFFFNCF
jgi:hypothetical protein